MPFHYPNPLGRLRLGCKRYGFVSTKGEGSDGRADIVEEAGGQNNPILLKWTRDGDGCVFQEAIKTERICSDAADTGVVPKFHGKTAFRLQPDAQNPHNKWGVGFGVELGQGCAASRVQDAGQSMRGNLLLYREMVHALKTLHSSGWMHGDCKLTNAVVPMDGLLRLMLIDFNRAKRLQEIAAAANIEPQTVGRSESITGAFAYCSSWARSGARRPAQLEEVSKEPRETMLTPLDRRRQSTPHDSELASAGASGQPATAAAAAEQVEADGAATQGMDVIARPRHPLMRSVDDDMDDGTDEEEDDGPLEGGFFTLPEPAIPPMEIALHVDLASAVELPEDDPMVQASTEEHDQVEDPERRDSSCVPFSTQCIQTSLSLSPSLSLSLALFRHYKRLGLPLPEEEQEQLDFFTCDTHQDIWPDQLDRIRHIFDTLEVVEEVSAEAVEERFKPDFFTKTYDHPVEGVLQAMQRGVERGRARCNHDIEAGLVCCASLLEGKEEFMKVVGLSVAHREAIWEWPLNTSEAQREKLTGSLPAFAAKKLARTERRAEEKARADALTAELKAVKEAAKTQATLLKSVRVCEARASRAANEHDLDKYKLELANRLLQRKRGTRLKAEADALAAKAKGYLTRRTNNRQQWMCRQPHRLGEGSRAIVRAGLVNGEWRAFKIAVFDGTNTKWRVALREMEVERQRMAMVQANREREGKELQPFLRLYDAATSLEDKAAYQESAGAPPKPCVYIEMQPLNEPLGPQRYVSLKELIWDMGCNTAAIGLCLDHCAKNIYVNKYKLERQEQPDAFLIDLANTALVKPPGPCMHSADGTVPTPPCPHAALIPVRKAAQREEQQLPTYTCFHAAPEQLLFNTEQLVRDGTQEDIAKWGGETLEQGPVKWGHIWDRQVLLRAGLREQQQLVGEGPMLGLWMTDRTPSFKLGCSLYNALRGELFIEKLEREDGNWPAEPQPPKEPPQDAAEDAKAAYQQQRAAYEKARKAYQQHRNVQQAIIGYWRGGLEWVEGALKRLDRIREAATRPLPLDRCSLAEQEQQLRSVVADLESVAKAKASGSSPAAAASLSSTAASPQGAHCPAPPASPDTSPAPVVAAGRPEGQREDDSIAAYILYLWRPINRQHMIFPPQRENQHAAPEQVAHLVKTIKECGDALERPGLKMIQQAKLVI
ncbi:unnamed protein product [Vitrella brassicaformis CCMP3155]|uniref:Protein kinase domain-containing protein n=1 Tax=Vitrella brassicaformis (strain CCMP3155) TaxID=1169540 RepID=A0A0G4H393_VITBC|nr:unnamed protein product [Vitrella brassicaformis CCMP3155]|eukprot:CEM38171.1 unnamed protein product [Vitrella brassicaformis CCMP3155]